MLTEADAQKAVETAFSITGAPRPADYENLWLFKIDLGLYGEEGMDPFVSVNKETGELAEFSVVTDADPVKFDAAFKAIQNQNDS